MGKHAVEYVKQKRKALEGEISLYANVTYQYPLPVVPALVPGQRGHYHISDEEKGKRIQECISAGFVVGATVIRPHHANVKREELSGLVGKIVGFDRMEPKFEYKPILVSWGRPGMYASGPFNYKLNELDLFNYEWAKL